MFGVDLRTVLLWVIGYLVCGAIWSTIRWKQYVDACLWNYRWYRDEFLESHGLAPDSDMPEELKPLWMTRWRYVSDKHDLASPPSIADQRFMVVVWSCFWPIGIVLTIFVGFNPVSCFLMILTWCNPLPKIGRELERMEVQDGKDIDCDARIALDGEINEGERNRW